MAVPATAAPCRVGAPIQRTLTDLGEFPEQRSNAANAQRVRELSAKLPTQTCNLVVSGEFRRGKTTLSNAVLRQASAAEVCDGT